MATTGTVVVIASAIAVPASSNVVRKEAKHPHKNQQSTGINKNMLQVHEERSRQVCFKKLND